MPHIQEDLCLPSRTKTTFSWAIAALLVVPFASCSRSATDYVPKTDTARQALTLVMDAYKAGIPGQQAGKISTGAVVRGMDDRWSAEKKLESYEIIEELPTTEAEPKKFRVRLVASGFAAPEESIYLVIGIDPLQVFREEDFDRIFNMEK